MKKKIGALLCALLLGLTLPITAYATERAIQASDYFSATDVRAYAEGGGRILIEVDVETTHTMLKVGASEVYIYEEQPSGAYEIVRTFTMQDNPSMVCSNCAGACIDVYYDGIPAQGYYALVGCYAQDANGSETLYFATNTVTA